MNVSRFQRILGRSLAVVAVVSLSIPARAMPCTCGEDDGQAAAGKRTRSCCCPSSHPPPEGDAGASTPEQRDDPGTCECPGGCLAPCCAGKLPCTSAALGPIGLAVAPLTQAIDASQSIHATPALNGIFRPPRA
jgi:hypothetical protein